MSDTPKFEVIDRRKIKAEEEKESSPTPAPQKEAKPEEKAGGPRLVVAPSADAVPPSAESTLADADSEGPGELPPPPSADERRQQKSAYDASAQRLEDLVRAQNPAIGSQPPIGFEHLVQQLYVSAMIQMGAGATEGQRPRVDILGAKQTIDLLGVLAEKTKGNLTPAEDRMLQTVLFEARIAFNELSSMISLQGVPTPPSKPDKH